MARPPTESRFYMTYSRTRPNELSPWIGEHDVPILENALHRWSDAKEAFLPMWEYETPHHVIDAGGYNVMASVVDQQGSLTVDLSVVDAELESDVPFYPWSVEQYHEWLCEHESEFEWACVMDYACEDRFNELLSVEERRELTFETTLKQFELLEDSNSDYELLPVLQGRSVDDYVEFYERLEDHGIPVDYVGVGTICRISSEKKLAEYETQIRERTGVEALHGFGIKIDAFRHGAEFETADSQAWVYHPTNGRAVLDDGDRLRRVDMSDNSLARTIASFKHYYSYVGRLQQGDSPVDLDTSVADIDADEVVRNELAARAE